MDKPAESKVPLLDPIAKRWSPRAFSSQAVEPEKLSALMEAARWAPSCFNEQPWRFLIETRDNEADFAKAVACLVPFNQEWAGKAPVLLFAAASTTFARNQKDNPHAWYDTGMAAENLTIQAQSLGLVAHQMAGFDADKVRATYGVPDGIDIIAAIAVGYQGDVADLNEDMAKSEKAPRVRRALNESFFSGTWGQAAAHTS